MVGLRIPKKNTLLVSPIVEEFIPGIRIFLDLIKHKQIRVIVNVGTAFTILMSLWQTYYILTNFEVQYFLKYFPLMLATTYVSNFLNLLNNLTEISIKVQHNLVHVYLRISFPQSARRIFQKKLLLEYQNGITQYKKTNRG